MIDDTVKVGLPFDFKGLHLVKRCIFEPFLTVVGSGQTSGKIAVSCFQDVFHILLVHGHFKTGVTCSVHGVPI